jgi:hypothetical protein
LGLNQDKNKDLLITLVGDDLHKDALYDRLSSDLQPVDESIIIKKREGLHLNKVYMVLD